MKKYFLIFIPLLLGLAFGYFIDQKINPDKSQIYYKVQAIRAGQNGLINPLVEYELDQGLYRQELKVFDDKVSQLIDSETSQGKVKNVAAYFRDLNNGPWFGINEDDNFFPASLLKVPIMISYFKQAETNPDLLKKQIKYDENTLKTLGDFNDGQYIKSEKFIEPGKTYTVEELINYMIIYSDNNAKNLLILNLGDINQLFNVYTDMGIASAPELRGTGDVLSVHEYARLYRVLYNASYLNKDMSKKALELLVQSIFPQGIAGGIPRDTKLANKFGEYSKDDIKQLHDCGIIYYPGKPYLLCIMTRGDNFEKLESTIEDISKLVYQEVDNQVKAQK